MTRLLSILIFSLGLTVPAAAQSRERGPDQVPKGHRPPPGMCRIWIDGVPPGQQPEPTDCATAVRERPAGARVIFGDRRDDDDDKDRKRPGITKSLRGEDDRRGRDDEERRGRRGGEDDDPTLRHPGSWPEMMSAIALTQGRRTDDVRRWLGSSAASVRYEDVDRDRRPERATWFDRAGQVVQVWIDLDRDGVADSIKLYRDGKLIRVYEK
ncbi:MAG: hypothetical protein M3125_03695 [Gemmatimonadota bacterium]|nr:hypothetical protein [Gemmatimonadota bacterium]